MPSTQPKRTAGAVPRPFEVLVPVPGKHQWGVRQGDRWRFCSDLCIQVTVTTNGARLLEGVGVVTTLKRGEIVIHA